MRVRRPAGLLFCLCGGLLLLAWATGRMTSDRWLWSQWLLWLPGLTLIPAFLLIGLGLTLLRFKRRVVLVVSCAALLGPLSDAVDLWRPLGGAPHTTRTLRLLHWTAGPGMRDPEVLLQAMQRTDPDVVVTLGPNVAAQGAALANWGAIPGPMRQAEFIVFSKYPVIRCRSLARSNDIQLAALDLDVHGQTVHVLLLDLPSDPTRSRWMIAQQARALIDAKVEGTVDLVLGDFNMSQLSTALRSILPGWKLATPRGSLGWGGTWPRALPLWRIDHVLVPADAPLPHIETFDPGAGRHRAQIIDLTVPR